MQDHITTAKAQNQQNQTATSEKQDEMKTCANKGNISTYNFYVNGTNANVHWIKII